MSTPGDDGEVLVCTQCGRGLDATDAYCRGCGASVHEEQPSIFQSRVGVLLMLFLGVGPFALPLLWKSPAFSIAQKVWITVLNLAFIMAIVWFLVWFYNFVVFRFTGLEFEPGF
jgi:hypothetical protein